MDVFNVFPSFNVFFLLFWDFIAFYLCIGTLLYLYENNVYVMLGIHVLDSE